MTCRPSTPCGACTEFATRSLGTGWFCDEHAEEILAPIRARVVEHESLTGAGRRCGLQRPDHGRHAADLACVACEATWVGVPGDRCPWCERRLTEAIERQREILLSNTTDPRRLAVAVKAGIITDTEARRALTGRGDRHAA